MLSRKYFMRRFLRRVVVTRQVEQHVGRDADQLQGQEQRDQVVGRSGQACAGDDEQQATVILAGLAVGHLVPAEQDQDAPPTRAMNLNNKPS